MKTVITIVAVATACALGHGQERSTADRSSTLDALLVRRFLSSNGPSLTSYRAIRRLEASARGGRMRAALSAMTWSDPDTGFGYDILSETGSGVIRSKVLRAALAAELKASQPTASGKASLTEANYEFTSADPAEDGLLRVGLTPRREDTMLIKGSVVLDPENADLLRVEGALVKRPSFWTRRVLVTRTYTRLLGVRVPIAMESRADVLVVGASSFSMTYDYSSINGVEVIAR